MRVFGADDGVKSNLSCGPGSEVAGRTCPQQKPCQVQCCVLWTLRFAGASGSTNCPQGGWEVEVPRRVATCDPIPLTYFRYLRCDVSSLFSLQLKVNLC